MSGHSLPSIENLSPSLALGIDRRCKLFEKALQAGKRPRIEAYLKESPEKGRAVLLCELLRLEIAYREKSGDRPALADYQLRFPDHGELLRAVLDPRNTASYTSGDSHRNSPNASSTGLDSGVVVAAVAIPPAIPGHELLGELGRGGMGVVYKMRHLALKRNVAVKVVLSGSHAGREELTRFRAEAEAVARLQHPNIVQIHEVGECDGRPFLSLEFVEGGSLEKKIKGTPQPAPEAARLVETLALAMQAAHERGIVHRDLKPANVLLTKEGQPKITDFGLAKKLDEASDQTKSGDIMGTPSYMAPEQAGGASKVVGPATDVYALGAILYELLTGRPPFKAPTPMDTMFQVMNDEPVAPASLQPRTPKDLETICLKCLQKDMGNRYASAEAMADDLRHFLKGEPITARPVSRVEKTWRWCRRNPALASTAGVALAAVVAFAISSVFLWLAGYANRLEREASRKELNDNSNNLASLFPRLHQLDEEQKAKLRLQLDKYKGLAEKIGDPSIWANAELGVASIFAILGDVDKAEASFRQAIGLYHGLSENDPDNADYLYKRAKSYARLGGVQWELGKWREAKTALHEASALATLLVTASPTSTEYRFELARSKKELGFLALDLGELKEAKMAFEDAIDSWKKLPEKLAIDSQTTLTDIFPNELDNRFNLAKGYFDLLWVLDNLSMPSAMKATYERVDKLLKDLEHESPASPEFRYLSAQNYRYRGVNYCKAQQWAHAEEAFEQSIQLGITLKEKYPGVPKYRLELAKSKFNLGWYLAQREKKQDAKAAYREAIDLAKDLTTESPKVLRFRNHLAECYNNLGDLLSHDEPEKAKKVYDEAIRLEEDLANRFPEFPHFQIVLGGTCSNYANVVRDTGNPKDAMGSYDKAIESLTAALGKDPSAHQARLFLRNAFWDRANALGELGCYAEAMNDWHQALKLNDRSGDSDALKKFLAAAEVECTLQNVSPVAADFYNAARTCAVAAKAAADKNEENLKGHYSRRALELLKEAESAGYFRDAATVVGLKNEPAFQHLRASASFQTFVNGLPGENE